MNALKLLANSIVGIFRKISARPTEESEPDYWLYLAGNAVLTLFFMNLFFWMLWTLMVYKGGIFAKIIPALKVIFTSASAADFGYEGYPYAMGIFDGWPENLAAAAVFVVFVEMCRRIYVKNAPSAPGASSAKASAGLSAADDNENKNHVPGDTRE